MEEDKDKSKLKIKIHAHNNTVDLKGFDNQIHACPKCNKEFSSGKALGGHMRIHMPVKKTEHRSESASSSINQRNNNEKDPTCSLCGKNFPSMKSLFGHMRCHPEREWRGIQPPAAPPAGNSPSSSSVSVGDVDDQVDLMQFMTGWSVTGLRGRKAIAPIPTPEPSSSEEDEMFRNAAGELLLLAQIDSIGSSVTKKQLDEEPSCIYRSKRRVIEDFADREIRDSPVKIMRVDEIEYPVAENRVDSKSCSDDELSYKNSENSRVKKRKKMKLTVDLASFSPINLNPLDSTDKYKCSTCNKCFPTHQALGGHRSSHNKFKITTINTIDESSSAAVITDQEDHHNNNNGNNLNCATTHQCKICNKTFNTGQALGGHKRCHWTGPTAQSESASEEASQPLRRSLEFDLNEVPTINDDDQEEDHHHHHDHSAGYGCDFALSSYNSNVSC